MGYSAEIKEFINKHEDIFWYTPKDKKKNVSEELLLETVLNYANLEDCLTLIRLIGVKKALEILKNAKGRKKLNYYPEIYNFFMNILSKNA